MGSMAKRRNSFAVTGTALGSVIAALLMATPGGADTIAVDHAPDCGLAGDAAATHCLGLDQIEMVMSLRAAGLGAQARDNLGQVRGVLAPTLAVMHLAPAGETPTRSLPVMSGAGLIGSLAQIASTGVAALGQFAVNLRPEHLRYGSEGPAAIGFSEALSMVAQGRDGESHFHIGVSGLAVTPRGSMTLKSGAVFDGVRIADFAFPLALAERVVMTRYYSGPLAEAGTFYGAFLVPLPVADSEPHDQALVSLIKPGQNDLFPDRDPRARKPDVDMNLGPVPLPAGGAQMLGALAALIGLRRRKWRKAAASG